MRGPGILLSIACAGVALVVGCVLVTGSTDGYQLVDAGDTCIDAQVTAPNVPDAAIGDSGTTTGACIGCIESRCVSEANACQADCSCRKLAFDFFGCLAAGKSATRCGNDVIASGSNLTLTQLGACVRSSGCESSACGGGGDGGGDGGGGGK
jgi:hypothetical protein